MGFRFGFLLVSLLGVSSSVCLQINNPIFDRNTRFSTPDQAIPLKTIQVFPNESDEDDGIYLGHAQDMAEDANGMFFIPDSRNDEVLVFSSAGRLLHRFGRSGQGPGEFLRPTGIACGPLGFTVQESQSLRFQHFSPRGDYLGGFRSKKFFFKFVIFKDCLIGAEAHYFPPAADDRNTLISVLGMDGAIKKRFGATIAGPVTDYFNTNRSCLAITAQKHLAVAFSFSPIVRFYDLDGTLIKEVKTEGGIIERFSPLNKAALEELKSGSQAPRAFMANAIDADSDGIYIAIAAPGRLEILWLNEVGERKGYFFKDLPAPLGCNALIVRSHIDGKHFYILRQYPYHAVEELIPLKRS